MKIFVDWHHIGLYNSLQLLFEKRLGHELYRPIGEEWVTEGYWKIAEPYGNNPDTIRQFLGTDTHKWESMVSLNGDYMLEDDIYKIYNPITKGFEKAIRFETFKEMEFDIIISTYQPHDVPFTELRNKYHPKAKLISQMGNVYQTSEIDNVMCSTMPYDVPKDKNVVFYHQEFDLNIFKYTEPQERAKITNFVNLNPASETYSLYKEKLPEYSFKSYGIGCPNGIISGEDKIASIMADSTFGFHVKPNGDGFGHIIHNWYACGRPIVTNGSDYKDKLAGNLLTDGETCIDLELSDILGNLEKIKYWSIPENHDKMCQNAYNRFKEIVDFDEEEQKLRKFLEMLI